MSKAGPNCVAEGSMQRIAMVTVILLARLAVAQDEQLDLEDEEPYVPRNDLTLSLTYAAAITPEITHGVRLHLTYDRFFGEAANFSLGYRLGAMTIPSSYNSGAGFMGLQGLIWFGVPDDVRLCAGPTADLTIASNSVMVTVGVHAAVRIPLASHFAFDIPLDVLLVPPINRLPSTYVSVSTGLQLAFPF
jgi:hypothetical protein